MLKQSDLPFYECWKCKKYCSFQFEGKVKHAFSDTFERCNVDLVKFALFLKKASSPFKYSKFDDKTSLSNRQDFILISVLKVLVDMIMNTQKNSRSKIEMKISGDFLDLYVESDTVLLADVIENFRDTWLSAKILDHA